MSSDGEMLYGMVKQDLMRTYLLPRGSLGGCSISWVLVLFLGGTLLLSLCYLSPTPLHRLFWALQNKFLLLIHGLQSFLTSYILLLAAEQKLLQPSLCYHLFNPNNTSSVAKSMSSHFFACHLSSQCSFVGLGRKWS